MMHRLGYWAVRLLVALLRPLPFRAIYALSDGLAFVLHRVIGYRRQVMYDNLRQAFPEKSEAEIQRIIRGAYRNLTDLTLETVKAFGSPVRPILERCEFRNPELINQYLDRGQSLIMGGAHLNSWEWPCLTIPHHLSGLGVTAYKPLSNPLVDQYYNQRREKGGMVMVSMEDTFRAIRKYHGQAAVFILVADQSPSSRKSAHWLPFFGRETAFVPGIDFLSRKFGYPVVYFHVDRIRRGRYAVTYRLINENPAQAAQEEITKAYAEVVEHAIRQQPENWLWSHKRWKMKK